MGRTLIKPVGGQDLGLLTRAFSWFPFGLGRLKNSCWVLNSAAGAESCQPVAGSVRFGALRPELQQDLGWKGPREVCGVSTGCSRGFTELGSGSPQGWRAYNCFSNTQLEKFSSQSQLNASLVPIASPLPCCSASQEGRRPDFWLGKKQN